MGGGQGASAHGDGKSALLYPTSAANTSVELMEARAPVLVVEKTLVMDSVAPGRPIAAGSAVRTRLRKLHDDGLPDACSRCIQKAWAWHRKASFGRPGGGARGVVLDPSGRSCMIAAPAS